MRNSLLILFTVVACATAHASGPIIGPLCIDGVKATPHPELTSPRDDGSWSPTDYEIDSAQARNARLTVFDRAITPSEKLESCRDVTKRMTDAGAQLIVSGKLRALTLRAWLFTAPSGNRIELKHGEFTATLSAVDSGARPVAGGSIDLRGSQLWIKVSDDVISTTSGINGELEIEAWNRKITGAQITFGQGLTYVTTLAPKNETNVTVRINLHDGLGRIWAGDLFGVPPKSASGDLQVPALLLRSADLQAARVGVVAVNGVLDATLTGLKGSAKEVLVPGPQLQWKVNDANLSIDRADGGAIQQSDRLSVEHASFRKLSIAKTQTTLQSTSGSELFKGTAETNFAQLSETERSVKSAWTAVSSVVLAPILPGGIARMDWNESGQTASLTVNGKFDTEQLKLGGINVGQPLSFVFGPASLTSDIIIPIKANLPAAAGSISFLNGDQTVGIQGRLERFAIDGTLVIPPSDIDASRIDVASGRLLITVGSAISVSPVVAGAKPNFLDAKVTVENDSDISISKAKSVGTALLTTSVLLLAQPVMQIGDNGTTNPATIDFKADGDAKFRYDLATGKSTIVKAKLTANDITFNLLGPTPRILDLGGDRITDPTGTLKRISIEIDQLSQVKVESADLEALNLNATLIQRVRPPGTETGLAYAGRPSKALIVETAHAKRISAGDAIVIGGWDINGLDFAIGSDASIDFGGGISVAHASVALHADQIREIEISDRRVHEVQNGRVSVSGKLAVHSSAMSINDAVETTIGLTLSGREDALNGEGSLKFGTFTGSLRSPISIAFDCRGIGHLDVDMETNIVIGGGDFHAQMSNGKMSADGAIGPIAALIHSTGQTGCDNPVTKHVIQEQGKYWTDGICNRGFEVYTCRWESPEISYAYHIHLGVRLLTATVTMTNPHLYLGSGGNIGVCNIGAATISGVALAGGYSPGIDTPYPGLDNIVNGLIQIGFEPAQSLAATAIGNGVGLLFSTIATPTGNMLCIGKQL
jgi:hypothetical protein